MDVHHILDYHVQNHMSSNPTMEMVREKQRQFLKVLPYKQLLRNEFRRELGLCDNAFDLAKPQIQRDLEFKPNWKFYEFMHG